MKAPNVVSIQFHQFITGSKVAQMPDVKRSRFHACHDCRH